MLAKTTLQKSTNDEDSCNGIEKNKNRKCYKLMTIKENIYIRKIGG